MPVYSLVNKGGITLDWIYKLSETVCSQGYHNFFKKSTTLLLCYFRIFSWMEETVTTENNFWAMLQAITSKAEGKKACGNLEILQFKFEVRSSTK